MDSFADKNVGQIRSASRTLVMPRPIHADDERTIIGQNREHWDGRLDATAITRPGIATPFGRAVNRRLLREHAVARYGPAAVAAREHRAALSGSGKFFQTELDTIDASALAVNTASDTFDVRLLDNSTTPNFDTNTLWSALSSGEISGTGYTADGQALSGLSVAISSGLNWDATDSQWTGASFTAYGAVIVDDTLTGDPMICLIYFGGAVVADGGNFDLAYASGGFMQGDNA